MCGHVGQVTCDNGVGWKLFNIQILVHEKIRVYLCVTSFQQLFGLLFSTNAQMPHGILDIWLKNSSWHLIILPVWFKH